VQLMNPWGLPVSPSCTHFRGGAPRHAQTAFPINTALNKSRITADPHGAGDRVRYSAGPRGPPNGQTLGGCVPRGTSVILASCPSDVHCLPDGPAGAASSIESGNETAAGSPHVAHPLRAGRQPHAVSFETLELKCQWPGPQCLRRRAGRTFWHRRHVLEPVFRYWKIRGR